MSTGRQTLTSRLVRAHPSEIPAAPPALARQIAFFLGLPAAMGFMVGWNQAEVAQKLPLVWSVSVWIAIFCVSWWVSEGCLAVAGTVLRPWSSELLPALLVASVANLVLSILYCQVLFEIGVLLAGGTPLASPPQYSRDLLDPNYLWVLIQSGGPGSLIWVGLRYCYQFMAFAALPGATFRTESMGGSVQEPPPRLAEPSAAQKLASLIARQGGGALDGVIALQAQDHYVRVHWFERSILVFMRFSEAIQAFPPEAGLRTHRSFWVRKSAMRSLQPMAAGARLFLSNDLEAPVSQANKALAVQAIEHARRDAGR